MHSLLVRLTLKAFIVLPGTQIIQRDAKMAQICMTLLYIQAAVPCNLKDSPVSFRDSYTRGFLCMLVSDDALSSGPRGGGHVRDPLP